MTEGVEFIVRAVLIGIGATVVVDVWSAFLKHVFAIPSLNWGMVGRWIGHFPRGQFFHNGIGVATPVAGETVIGWVAHFGTGIAFACVLVAIWGLDWARHPTPIPALIVGIVSVTAPFFIMQPGMGAGIAASKTPKPKVARLRSLMTHAVFGIGLYVSAVLGTLLIA